MRICSLISHTAIGCGGLIGGWLVAVGQLGITCRLLPKLRRHHQASEALNFSTA